MSHGRKVERLFYVKDCKQLSVLLRSSSALGRFTAARLDPCAHSGARRFIDFTEKSMSCGLVIRALRMTFMRIAVFNVKIAVQFVCPDSLFLLYTLVTIILGSILCYTVPVRAMRGENVCHVLRYVILYNTYNTFPREARRNVLLFSSI